MPQQKYYKVTQMIEVTTYRAAHSPLAALAIAYQEAEFNYGHQRIVSERIEVLEEPPAIELVLASRKKFPHPEIRAVVVSPFPLDKGEHREIGLPINAVESDGIDSAVSLVFSGDAQVVSCNIDEYYVSETGEPWKPLTEPDIQDNQSK